MKVENVQAAMRTKPYRTFTIRTGSGGSYLVRRPEMIAVSPDASVVLVIHGPGQTAMIDLESITELDFDLTPRKSTSATE